MNFKEYFTESHEGKYETFVTKNDKEEDIIVSYTYTPADKKYDKDYAHTQNTEHEIEIFDVKNKSTNAKVELNKDEEQKIKEAIYKKENA